jgi:hypothetical protein
MAEYTNWSVEKKLARARAILAGKALKKSGQNKQKYQDKRTGEWKEMGFSYFELSDFLPDTLKIFDELGLCGIFAIIPAHSEDKPINGEMNRIMYPETAELKVVNADNKEDYIIFREPTAKVEMKSEIQSLGAKKTYLRRYLWIDCMEIAENEMVDAQTADEKEEEKPIPQKPAVQTAPPDMAVEFTRLRGELAKVGYDLHDEQVANFIKERASVNTVDPGILLGDVDAMSRVLAIMTGVLKAKQS